MYSEFLHSQHDRVFGEQYDKCIIGYDLNTGQIVYSVSKIVKVLQKDEHLEYYDAIDFVNQAFKGQYRGNSEPILLMDIE
jgi:hypothetical protein